MLIVLYFGISFEQKAMMSEMIRIDGPGG